MLKLHTLYLFNKQLHLEKYNLFDKNVLKLNKDLPKSFIIKSETL